MDKNYFVNGHVQLINNTTNKILVDADNLIVNDGREAIIETLKQAGFFKIYNSELYDATANPTIEYIASLESTPSDQYIYTFKKIIFGYGNDEVLPTDTYDKIKQLSKGSGSYWDIDITKTSRQYTSSTRSIEFTISFTGETVFTGIASENSYSTAVISELGIVLDKTRKTMEGSSPQYFPGDDVLFSRIKFDSISIVSDNTYTLKYVLYF